MPDRRDLGRADPRRSRRRRARGRRRRAPAVHVAELDALLETQLAGPAIIRVRDDAHGELVDLDVGLIGARVGVTPAGWRFALVTMISRVEWDAIDAGAAGAAGAAAGSVARRDAHVHRDSSDALLALTSGGAKYGAGASTSLPVGVWSGWTYRGAPPVPVDPVDEGPRDPHGDAQASARRRRSASGSGARPKTRDPADHELDWSAGSSSSPSSGNAVVWPGPTTTATGAVTSSLPTAQNADRRDPRRRDRARLGAGVGRRIRRGAARDPARRGVELAEQHGRGLAGRAGRGGAADARARARDLRLEEDPIMPDITSAAELGASGR